MPNTKHSHHEEAANHHEEQQRAIVTHIQRIQKAMTKKQQAMRMKRMDMRKTQRHMRMRHRRSMQISKRLQRNNWFQLFEKGYTKFNGIAFTILYRSIDIEIGI